MINQLIRLSTSTILINQRRINRSLSILYNNFSTFDCQNCSRLSSYPQCSFCHRMVNYFKIFNLPQDYHIDPRVIKQMAKNLQKQFHPDKHPNKDVNEQINNKMVKYSSYINEAKTTLLNDLQRAIYLMELKGIQVDQTAKLVDNRFMLEVFDLQERIENADQKEAIQIKDKLEEVIDALQKELENFFRSDDIAKCEEFIGKYKYIQCALVNVRKKLEKIKEDERISLL